jgi:xanthine dehydrogenase YagT iron-sulfur-binding subunit
MDVSRREFLKSLSAAGALGSIALERAGMGQARAEDGASGAEVVTLAAAGAPLALTVNGTKHELTVEPRATLLDLLRTKLGITGPKDVCDRGACGACTVLVDGEPRVSCMLLAHDVAGRKVETVEGIGTPEKPHALQKAFAECDALQCGFCTPGMVVSLKCLMDHNPKPSLAEIKSAVSGNVCRCGTYTRIFEAAQKACGGAR